MASTEVARDLRVPLRERVSMALAVLAVLLLAGSFLAVFIVGWLATPGLPAWPPLAMVVAYGVLTVAAVVYVFLRPRRPAS